MLRTAVIAAGAPVIEDAVVTGHDRDEIGLLIFPSLAGLSSLCPELGADAKLEDMVGHAGGAQGALAEGLERHNAQSQGSSMRIARCLLLTEPPSIDANEITDKGYLNQRAVLTKRAALVERLHGRAGGAGCDRDCLKEPELHGRSEPRADHRSTRTSGSWAARARRSPTTTARCATSPPPTSASRPRARL